MTPSEEPRLARTAAMIADPARSRMLALLLDGHYASAGELAAAGGVSAPTASAHLAKLVDNGLLAVESRGRHRYFKLADADVAHALEALSLLADRSSHQRQWQRAAQQGLRYARCCYGHLAGELGVQLMAALQSQACIAPVGEGGDLARSFVLTATGHQWMADLGVAPLPAAQQRGRRLAYACLDWSERRDHLAGGLATVLLEHFLARGWLRAAPGSAGLDGHPGRNRGLVLTPPGRQRLLPLLRLAHPALRSC